MFGGEILRVPGTVIKNTCLTVFQQLSLPFRLFKASRWMCFSRAFGLEDFLRSLPTPTILWFYEILFLVLLNSIVKYLWVTSIYSCPGFSQDRVNFSREHSRAGWPNLAKQSRVFHTMCHHAGFWLGGDGGQEVGCAQEHARSSKRWECLCGFCSLCCIFSLSVSLLLLFPFFAVLLNCPYPDPPVFACFLSILFPTPVGGGAAEQPHGPFIASHSQNITILNIIMNKYLYFLK